MPVQKDLLRRMTQTMLHRGPDDGNLLFDDPNGIGLGFRRLSIVDISWSG